MQFIVYSLHCGLTIYFSSEAFMLYFVIISVNELVRQLRMIYMYYAVICEPFNYGNWNFCPYFVARA